ncbi:hypothetical protein OROGR_009748 [Orobanche gracilis]
MKLKRLLHYILMMLKAVTFVSTKISGLQEHLMPIHYRLPLRSTHRQWNSGHALWHYGEQIAQPSKGILVNKVMCMLTSGSTLSRLIED